MPPRTILVELVLALALLLPGLAGVARAAPRGVPAEEALEAGELDVEDLVGRATIGRRRVRSAPGGEAWLSLVGFTRSATTGQRELGGFIVLGLPLDRILRAGSRAAFADPKIPSAPAPATPPPSPLPAGPGAPVGNEGVIVVTPRIARACVASAWRTSGLGADDTRLDAIMARARWSALLPETRLRAIRYDDERVWSDAGTAADGQLRDSAGARVGLEARLTWRLDRLLYGEDEPSFERMKMERQDARSRIAARVLEALFHWQRARMELSITQAGGQGAGGSPDVEAALRLMEAEVTLDVLTAGWFSAWRASRVVKLPAPPTSEGA